MGQNNRLKRSERRCLVAVNRGMTPWPTDDRLPPIAADKMTPEQKKAAEEFAAGRGYSARGPFAVMLRSPEVMLRAKAMGDYLRFRNVLPKRVSEMVILITAREWTQQYEWAYHYEHRAGGGPGQGDRRGHCRRAPARAHGGGRGRGLRLLHRAAQAPQRERRHLCARAEAVRRAGHHRSHRRQRLLHLQRHDDERGAHAARHRQGATR